MCVHSHSKRLLSLAISLLLLLLGTTASSQLKANNIPSLRDLVDEAIRRDAVVARSILSIRDRQLNVMSKAAQDGFKLSIGLSDPAGPVPLLGLEITDVGNEKLDYTFGVTTDITADLPAPMGNVTTSFSVVGPVEEDNESEEDPWIQPPFSFGAITGFQQSLSPLIGVDDIDSEELEILHLVKKSERSYRAQIRSVTYDILDQIITVLQYQTREHSSNQELADIEDEVSVRREIYNENEKSHNLQTLLFNLEKSRREGEITKVLLEQARATLEDRTGYRIVPYLSQTTIEIPSKEDANRAPDVVDAVLEVRLSEYRIDEENNRRWPEIDLNVNYDWKNRVFIAGVGFDLSHVLVDGGLQQLQDEELSNAHQSAQLASQIALRKYSESLIEVSNRIREIEHSTWEIHERLRLSALEIDEIRVALAAGIVTERDLVHADLKYRLIAIEEQILRAQRWKLRIEIDSLTDADSLETLAEQ